MVSLSALWLPIIVAALTVFSAGFILYMVLPHHRTDFRPIPQEEDFQHFVGEMDLGCGQYAFPHKHAGGQSADEAKLTAGPAGIFLLGKSSTGMARKFILHFAHILVISFMAAYMGSASLPAGVEYLKVFQVVGTAAFLGYAGAVAMYSIWYYFSWSFTLKYVADGLVYAMLTAGVFGWLWP